jgi:hypothetical protein
MAESQETERQRRAGPLHQRPRLGGDGRLRLPGAVHVTRDGTVRVPRFKHVVDPFEPSVDELLLAESFARLDAGDPQESQGWFLYHGALDRSGFWGDAQSGSVERPGQPIIDTSSDIATEQVRVRWLLAIMVGLSEHRLDGDWDRARDMPVPPVAEAWDEDTLRAGDAADLVTTWEGAVELTRRLIAPYVAIAVERTFGIEPEQQETAHGSRNVLVPFEWRVWRSVLAPISLQLFEALRRITEGEVGAITCQECDQPFLVLDARRRAFCNERHRHRHNERRRRRRLAQERQSSRESGGDKGQG